MDVRRWREARPGAAGPARPARWARWARRAAIATALLGLVATAACTDREVTRPEAGTITEERLREAALEAGDLPGGVEASPTGTSGGIGAQLLPNLPCDDVLDGLSPQLESGATLSTGAVQITSDVAWFPGAGSAAADVFSRVRTSCREAVDTSSGVTVRASRLRFGALTDRTLPLKLELEPRTGPITEVAVIVVREGDLLHVIRAAGERPISREVLDAAARAAIGKLSALALDTRA